MILRQEAASSIAAGQHEEHERAKDRNPLMFSFADVNCPNRYFFKVCHILKFTYALLVFQGARSVLAINICDKKAINRYLVKDFL